MGLMDKVFFWRHKELKSEAEIEKAADLALGKDRELGLEEPYESGPVPPGQQPGLETPGLMPGQPPEEEPPVHAPPHAPSAFQQQAQPHRDMELISAKLDALKATLDNINHRLENIERMAREGI